MPETKVGNNNTHRPPPVVLGNVITDCDDITIVESADTCEATDNDVSCDSSFADIRRVCESNSDTSDIDLRPAVFHQHRLNLWPTANAEGMEP